MKKHFFVWAAIGAGCLLLVLLAGLTIQRKSQPASELSWVDIERQTIRREFPNRIKVALLPRTGDDRVCLVLILRYGDAESLNELRDAESFLPFLLCGDVNAECSPSSLAAGVVKLQIKSPKDDFPTVLTSLHRSLRAPSFDNNRFVTLQSNLVAGLELEAKQQQEYAARLADDLLSRSLTPSRRTIDERIAGTRSATVEQVQELYEKHFGQGEVECAVVGDFQVDPTLDAISEMFEFWKPTVVRTPSHPVISIKREPSADETPQRQAIRASNQKDAAFNAGLSIPISGSDDDLPALILGMSIFDARLQSRLGQNNIPSRGELTRSVGAHVVSWLPDADPSIRLYAKCAPSDISTVEMTVLRDFERFIHEGGTAREFDQAKRQLLVGRNRRLGPEWNFYIAEQIAQSLKTNPPAIPDAQLDAKLKALTHQKVSAAIKKYLEPNRLKIVVAGDISAADN